MTPAIQAAVADLVTRYELDRGDVVELGSRNVNGGVRHLLRGADEYTGVDQEPGPGVDVALNARAFAAMAPTTYDTALCLETLEHDPAFWEILSCLKVLTRPGGHIVLSVPGFAFPYHAYPIDCYRFSRDALASWAAHLHAEQLECHQVADTQGNPGLVAIYRRRDGH